MKNDGKSAEKLVKTLFENGGSFVERFIDTHDSCMTQAVTCDFCVWSNNLGLMLEVKSTMSDTIYKSVLKNSQLRRQKKALINGTPGVYVFVINSGQRIEVHSWASVIVWHSKSSMRGPINKHFNPLQTIVSVLPSYTALSVKNIIAKLKSDVEAQRRVSALSTTIKESRRKYGRV